MENNTPSWTRAYSYKGLVSGVFVGLIAAYGSWLLFSLSVLTVNPHGPMDMPNYMYLFMPVFPMWYIFISVVSSILDLSPWHRDTIGFLVIPFLYLFYPLGGLCVGTLYGRIKGKGV